MTHDSQIQPVMAPLDELRRPATSLSVLAAAASLLVACSDSTGPPQPVRIVCESTSSEPFTPVNLALQEVTTGLARPAYMTSPQGDDRLFVVEQYRGIRIVEDGVVHDDLFLNLQGQIGSGFEQGVLGLAFDPEYGSSGEFYVTHVDPSGDSHLTRYRVSSNPDSADPSSRRPVLSVPQPSELHNGGRITFGPDGMLYFALGDGSLGADSELNAQDPLTLLGSLLRLDAQDHLRYGIPSDNPFVNKEGADEIWAYGLRNPWNVTFDRESGCMWIADVGEHSREEVNAVRDDAAGVNFGWSIMEGTTCFGGGQACDSTGLVQPVVEYGGDDDGCAVIGGHVYRGASIPALRGSYLYADFCSDWLRSFRIQNGEAVDMQEWSLGGVGSPVMIAQDSDRELYVLTFDGGLYRLVEQ